jgi:hypothetical protein
VTSLRDAVSFLFEVRPTGARQFSTKELPAIKRLHFSTDGTDSLKKLHDNCFLMLKVNYG